MEHAAACTRNRQLHNLKASFACNAHASNYVRHDHAVRPAAETSRGPQHLVALPGLREGRVARVDEVHDQVLVLRTRHPEEEPPAGVTTLHLDTPAAIILHRLGIPFANQGARSACFAVLLAVPMLGHNTAQQAASCWGSVCGYWNS